MSLRILCPCGKVLIVADKLSGKSIACPACKMWMMVPVTDYPDFELVGTSPEEPGFEVVETHSAPAQVAVAKPVAKRTIVATVDEEEDEHDRYEKVRDDPPPKKKRKKSPKRGDTRTYEQKKYDNSFWGFERGIINGGACGGAICMLIAVVWFVVAIVYADRIYFYPPILFVVGAIGFFRGIASHDRYD